MGGVPIRSYDVGATKGYHCLFLGRPITGWPKNGNGILEYKRSDALNEVSSARTRSSAAIRSHATRQPSATEWTF